MGHTVTLVLGQVNHGRCWPLLQNPKRTVSERVSGKEQQTTRQSEQTRKTKWSCRQGLLLSAQAKVLFISCQRLTGVEAALARLDAMLRWLCCVAQWCCCALLLCRFKSNARQSCPPTAEREQRRSKQEEEKGERKQKERERKGKAKRKKGRRKKEKE